MSADAQRHIGRLKKPLECADETVTIANTRGCIQSAGLPGDWAKDSPGEASNPPADGVASQGWALGGGLRFLGNLAAHPDIPQKGFVSPYAVRRPPKK